MQEGGMMKDKVIKLYTTHTSTSERKRSEVRSVWSVCEQENI
jgi:hypothetical protein